MDSETFIKNINETIRSDTFVSELNKIREVIFKEWVKSKYEEIWIDNVPKIYLEIISKELSVHKYHMSYQKIYDSSSGLLFGKSIERWNIHIEKT